MWPAAMARHTSLIALIAAVAAGVVAEAAEPEALAAGGDLKNNGDELKRHSPDGLNPNVLADVRMQYEELNKLANAPGDGGEVVVDPTLKKRLESLKQTLESMENDQEKSKQRLSHLEPCLNMSITRLGKSSEVVGRALKALSVDKLPVTLAGELDLHRMILVCVNELTDEELAKFTRGDLFELPGHMEREAKKQESVSRGFDIDAAFWQALRVTAQHRLEADFGDLDKPSKAGTFLQVAIALPFLLLMQYVMRKLMDRRTAAKANKKAAASKTKASKKKA